MKDTLITLAVLLLFSTSAYAGAVAVPNIFVAGTPAKASEVNANFSALTTTGALTVQAAGQDVGKLAGSFPDNLFWGVVSNKGYYFKINLDGTINSPSDFIYDTANCSGNAYLSGVPFTLIGQGYVFGPQDPLDQLRVYYLPKGSVGITINVLSRSTATGCQNVAPFQLNGAILISVNDPIITGIQSGTFSLPIRVAF